MSGTAVAAGGLFLISRMGAGTSFWIESLCLLVLGAGIGLIMQILTLVVQNTVPYEDLGTATGGVTFFRTLGGSFGASIMGSVYANQRPAIAARPNSSDDGITVARAHAVPSSLSPPAPGRSRVSRFRRAGYQVTGREFRPKTTL